MSTVLSVFEEPHPHTLTSATSFVLPCARMAVLIVVVCEVSIRPVALWRSGGMVGYANRGACLPSKITVVYLRAVFLASRDILKDFVGRDAPRCGESCPFLPQYVSCISLRNEWNSSMIELST